MEKTYDIDEWIIRESGYTPENNKKSESIFSLGNGKFGQRANFEESYSGPTMQGSYVAGVYYPDKTRVGWWKNGYPEYFAKVLNAPNWTSIKVYINDTELDLAKCEVSEFTRELDMKEGVLRRYFTAVLPDGTEIKVSSFRFISIVDDECAALKYTITPINKDAKIKFVSIVDADVHNEDSNYGEKFWETRAVTSSEDVHSIVASTKKTDFWVGTAMKNSICGGKSPIHGKTTSTDHAIKEEFSFKAKANDTCTLYKYVSVISSLFYNKEAISKKLVDKLSWVSCKSFDKMYDEQKLAWAKKWEHSDIIIKGDPEAQQAIRFNIFQLNQTYTGDDDRLNIGPKGFTGEKYGGSTYWDTEAYCFPFYMSTSGPKVALQLLKYRHEQLGKAIENAEKLGFKNGAALYPMVTMNGEECHNEWEITFEEIHRNGAIAFAIYDYTRYTGDSGYRFSDGFEVLTGIARFWSQRVNFSQDKQKYVILGVTGPNEYENNVNNNWYTNYIAKWCLEYAAQTAIELEAKGANLAVIKKLGVTAEETGKWLEIAENMYLPINENDNVFLQNDGYLDKELIPAKDIPSDQRPINQYWSWDRILRSCYIKQADTIQGLYFFEDQFSTEEIKRNFDFYEPLTVHESSLSPCIYSAVASKIGYPDKAYELYLRTARLDLDDYNKEADEGLHITSMAGTWISIVKGFAGMRVIDNALSFAPNIPEQWEEFSFKIIFRGAYLTVSISKTQSNIEHTGGNEVQLLFNDKLLKLKIGSKTPI